ncbi:hypothetical protein M5689_005399 [Euphorbia peplus]|nr:hypothetical protein M5689_005399 [Euphorbia peplus]
MSSRGESYQEPVHFYRLTSCSSSSHLCQIQIPSLWHQMQEAWLYGELMDPWELPLPLKWHRSKRSQHPPKGGILVLLMEEHRQKWWKPLKSSDSTDYDPYISLSRLTL